MDILSQGRAVAPLTLLAQRESRAKLLEELAHEYPGETLISFKLNIPGPIKTSPILAMVFAEGLSAITHCLDQPELLDRTSLAGGPEAILKTPAPAKEVKQAMVALEDSTRLARLYDIDVHSAGQAVSREELGLHPRRCLLCGQSARYCGRARTHTLEELLAAITKLIEEDPAMKRRLEGSGEV